MAMKIVYSSLIEKRILKLTDAMVTYNTGAFSTKRVRFEQINYVLFSDTSELTIGYGKHDQLTIQTSPKKPKHQQLIDELIRRLNATRAAVKTPAPTV